MISEVRRDPLLLGPFVLAGVILAAIDLLRRHDPLPTNSTLGGPDPYTVHVSIYPGGLLETSRSIDALVDLRTPYLLWGVGLELVASLVVVLAGWVTIRRALDSRATLASLARYLVFVLVVSHGYWLVGSVSIEPSSFAVGIAILVAVFVLLVRVFLVPVYIVQGREITSAMIRSVRTTRGLGWTVFGVIVVITLATWGLVQLPAGETVGTTAVVGPVHALSMAVIVRWNRGDD